jgi:hypothetical protein
MHTTKTTPCSQRRRLASAPIQIISTTFIIDAMVGRCLRQFKMPRPNAYGETTSASIERLVKLHTERHRAGLWVCRAGGLRWWWVDPDCGGQRMGSGQRLP